MSEDVWSSFHDDIIRPVEKQEKATKAKAFSSAPSFRTAGIEWDGKSGELRTGPVEDAPEDWSSLLSRWGLDPNEVHIEGPVRRSSWEVLYDGEVRTLNSYRAQIVKNTTDLHLDTEKLLEDIRKHKPSKKVPEEGDNAFVVCAGDTQLGKALDDLTPILTSRGWTTHGDLKAGDEVMSPEGKFVKVVSVTGSTIQECFRVEFDGGVSLTASGEHLWAGERAFKDKPYTHYTMRPVVMTTKDLLTLRAEQRGARVFINNTLRIQIPAPIELPEARVPVDPYILGVWLGDGYSRNGSIGMLTEDILDLGLHGTEQKNSKSNMTTICVPGLHKALREANLLRNKHIPSVYLNGSVEQRLSLLQGLMDTDGHISDTGTAEFSSTRINLAEGVAFLVNSLGMKAKVVKKSTTWVYKGIRKHGNAYRVTFTVSSGNLIPFRLSRKVNICVTALSSPHNAKTLKRCVKSVTYVGPVPAQCITVEGSLYLAGKDLVVTHNSGTEATIGRFLASLSAGPQRLKELRAAGRNIGPIFLPWLGDCIEGVQGHYPNQTSTVELTLTEQIRVLRRLAWQQLKTYAPLTSRLVIPVVPGNHDEAVRVGGKQITHQSDSFANDMASYLYDLVSENKKAYGHVEIVVPERNSLVVTLDICGTTVAMAHGHQFQSGTDGPMKWWAGQAHGVQPAGEATLLLGAHKHHLVVKQEGIKTFIQVPALDSGSLWYTNRTGQDSPPGLVSLVVGQDGWRDLAVL